VPAGDKERSSSRNVCGLCRSSYASKDDSSLSWSKAHYSKHGSTSCADQFISLYCFTSIGTVTSSTCCPVGDAGQFLQPAEASNINEQQQKREIEGAIASSGELSVQIKCSCCRPLPALHAVMAAHTIIRDQTGNSARGEHVSMQHCLPLWMHVAIRWWVDGIWLFSNQDQSTLDKTNMIN
jgi:hypothetical protein